jgi:hypothetical protein
MPFFTGVQPGSPWPPDITIRFIELDRRDALSRGNKLEHHRLGLCRVVLIDSPHTVVVRRIADSTYYAISGLSFGPGAKLLTH